MSHDIDSRRAEQERAVADLGLERFIELKVDGYFERMGDLEARSVHRSVIEQVERPLIRKCLEHTRGNKLRAARVLGINRNTLTKKVKEYGIEQGS